jgi:limonene-1,2-epoxide hydrolase
MSKVSRRNTFVAGVIGVLALAGFASCAQAHGPEMSAEEKANVKVVDDFIASFNDPAKLATFFSNDASIRMVDEKPAVIGPKAFLEEVKKISNPGDKFEVVTHDKWAKGPMVVNSRTDIVKSPGKPDMPIKIAGFFIVRNGKITEWTDYIVK